MVTSTDIWWSSNLSSGELSRQAAHRSAQAQAVRSVVRAPRTLGRIPLPRRLRAWRLPRFAAVRTVDR
ncbi:hypothetical protein [Pedococcus sp. P5_B7]